MFNIVWYSQIHGMSPGAQAQRKDAEWERMVKVQTEAAAGGRHQLLTGSTEFHGLPCAQMSSQLLKSAKT